MKKAAVGMLVVLALTLGLASRGDGKTLTTIGCVKSISHLMGSDGKIRAR